LEDFAAFRLAAFAAFRAADRADFGWEDFTAGFKTDCTVAGW
jgi:hypothetical protein